MIKKLLFTLLFLSICSTGWCSLLFDMTDDLIDIGNVAALDFDGTTPFSIVALVKRTGLGGARVIISKNDGTKGWTLWFRGGNPLGFFIRVNSSTNSAQVRTQDLWQDINTWLFIVATYDGSQDVSGMKIYVNGVSQVLITEQNTLSSSIANGGSVRIGSRSAGSDYYEGVIDGVHVYDVELTQADVDQIYNSKIKTITDQIKVSNQVESWLMDDGPHDSSADGDVFRGRWNGNNGTGDDGANNSGLTWKAEEILTYP